MVRVMQVECNLREKNIHATRMAYRCIFNLLRYEQQYRIISPQVLAWNYPSIRDHWLRSRQENLFSNTGTQFCLHKHKNQASINNAYDNSNMSRVRSLIMLKACNSKDNLPVNFHSLRREQ